MSMGFIKALLFYSSMTKIDAVRMFMTENMAQLKAM